MTEGSDDLARFSPDGSMILFLRSEGVRTSLYRSALVAPEPRKLLDNVSYADWSPGGKQIVFVRHVNERSKISTIVGIVGSDGGNAREIAHVSDETRHIPVGLRMAD